MLFDGYQFEDIKHIIAFLGGNKYWQNIIVNPSLLRQHYSELIELSYNALSKRKANRFIYKLQNNLLEKHLNLQETKVYIEQENTSNLYEQTALHFNIPSSTLIYDWNKFCSKFIGYNMSDKHIPNSKKSKHSKSIDITINKVEDSEEVRQLKERISELENELYYQSALTAYLKKLEALMQEKRQRNNKSIKAILPIRYSVVSK